MTMNKILILTSCTSKKKSNPSNLLTIDDFKNKDLLKTREEELTEYKCKAIDMYKGLQHTNIIDGVNQLKELSIPVDVAIISAGYGLLLEDDMIVPYEVTFNNMNTTELTDWAKHLNISHDVNELIKGYDIILVLLGGKYLKALELPLHLNMNQIVYFFETKKEDAKLFSYPLVGLKGYQFKLLCNYIYENNITDLDSIFKDSEKIKKILISLINRQ